jgi:type II secretory pathway pseudopilin PulG
MRQSRDGERGFTIVEAVVATALLGVIAMTVLGGLLFGMTQAHSGLNRAAAAAWAQTELDYLRLQGYAGLTPATRTLSPTGGYTTYGSIAEPHIPAGFDHAVITIQTLPGLPVKQGTVTLYQTASSVYATLAMYVSNFTHP